MKRNISKIFSLILPVMMLVFAACVISSCDSGVKTSEQSVTQKYEVAFDSDGGTAYYTVRGKKGDVITLPEPEKEGYVFDGWFVDDSFTGDALDGTYTIFANATLYAKWTAYRGVVHFESNSGTEYKDVEFCAQKVNIPTPEREGHIFAGWYRSSMLLGEKVSGVILPKGDVTLYAKWTKITGSVVFESNGGTQFEPVLTAGQKIKLPVPERENYIFAG